MKKYVLLALFAIGILSFVIAAPAAAVPQAINYQGILRDNAGNLQTGSYSMTFKIFDNSDGTGTAKYTKGPSNIVVSGGIYNVSFEVTSAILAGDRWLEITVQSDTLLPRLKINSVAYAIASGTAETASYAVTAGNADTVDSRHIIAGTGTIEEAATSATITNTAVAASSLIFLTPSTDTATQGILYNSSISAGASFTVKTTVAAPSGGLTFKYLIIN